MTSRISFNKLARNADLLAKKELEDAEQMSPLKLEERRLEVQAKRIAKDAKAIRDTLKFGEKK